MRKAFVIACVFVTAGVLWTTSCDKSKPPAGTPSTSSSNLRPEQAVVTVNPKGIMDTDCELTAIVLAGQEDKGQQAVRDAEAVLRDIEQHLSSHLADSEITAVNKAAVGEEVPLSPMAMEVLKTSMQYTKSTDGVFNVTVRPLLQLWKSAGKAKRLPTDQEVAKTLSEVGWQNFRLSDKGITKLKEGASIDLGGIAKKYGIDKAAETMMKAGIQGGIVNIGGDLRVFGERKGYGKWQIGIKNPFETDQILSTMSIKEGAVCTSGNYERFVIIDGKRYSHIVDARTGRTADAVPSVTVYGKTAIESGVWATALSVLGPEGFKLAPKDVEAMVITGVPKDYKYHYTDGFTKLLNELPEEPLPPLPSGTQTAPAETNPKD